ncbi:MAG TPA: TadE family protein [Phenylobacterium sp.]|nr:TadE family protein [Phenylobacterium sp.]
MRKLPRLKVRKSSGTGIWAETGGAAAVEFVLWVAILVVPVFSAIDIGIYASRRMQLEIAAQAAAQAAWHLCDKTGELPAVKNCTNLLSTMTTAAQATSLGSTVTVVSGYPIEGYYCIDNTGALQPFGTPATIGGTPTKSAATCTGTTTPPADYIQVQVSYPYSPIFSGLSLAALLTTPITRTAWMRLR